MGIGCAGNFFFFLHANSETELKVKGLIFFIQIGFFVPELIHTCGTDGTSVEVYELPKIPSTHSSKSWLTTSLHSRKSPIDNCLHDINNSSPGRHFEKYDSLVVIRTLRKACHTSMLTKMASSRPSSRSKKAKRAASPAAAPAAPSKRRRPITVS